MNFTNNSVVYHDCELKILICQDESIDLYDGSGYLGGNINYLGKRIRPVTPFILNVVHKLHNYKTKMSKNRVLNSDTSNRFEMLVLNFIDKYDSWTETSATEFEHIYAYQDRLVELKNKYEKEMSEI